MPVLMPTSLDEALAALAAMPDAVLLAGGTDLMVDVNEGRRRPATVIALRRVTGLRGVRVDHDDLVIGAATTYTDLLAPEVATRAPALAQAARTVGSPQIRNAGTIGGNLATASPAGDTLPVLLALGASVDVRDATGVRSVPVHEFLVGPKQSALRPGEVIVAVRVPIRRGPQEFLKVGVRNAMVIAVASLALAIDLEARTVGVALGSVGPTALIATDASAWLAGRLEWHGTKVTLHVEHVAVFASTTAAAAVPIDDHRSSARYRGHAIAVLATRALRRALAA
jgi:CO/xanthine dehydrogenase FAD-binding subunit